MAWVHGCATPGLQVLRDALIANPSLKVVLMSATLNAGLFAGYFGPGTATLHIPGRTFPIVDYSLEDALELTGYTPKGKMWRARAQMGRLLRRWMSG